jgi:1,4-alpha-glucan branching enzyme
MGIGDTLIFKLYGFQSAEKVILSGSFNAWSHNELVMIKTDDGWELPYVLEAGNYEYKFIVDGKWITDPANPLTTGSGDFMNSCITFKPNYTFSLTQFSNAKTVIVTGSFNGWQEDSYPMIRENGIWKYPVHLNPGKYSYKFIVDGRWMIDPANELWEENEFGTGNSVLWIER